MSVSSLGFGSGMDLQSLLEGLMKIEAGPQDLLKKKLTTHQTTVSQYQQLNTKFSNIRTAAEAINLGSSWKVHKATSSDDRLATATASSAAISGTFSFSVQSLATAHSMATSGTVTSTDDVIGSGTISIQVGSGTATNIDLGDGKLSTVVNNINAAKAGVTAAAVQVAPGQYKLQIQSSTTGTAGAITMDVNAFSGTMGSLANVSDPTDAVLRVGNGAGAYNITSSSNTVTDAMPGLTLNLVAADPTKTVNVTVGGDSEALADKVKAFVDAANDALGYIKINSTYDPKLKTGGAFLGDSMVRRLQQQVVSAVSDGVSGSTHGSLSSIGIKVGSDGAFTFDRTKFIESYKSDPEAVVSLFVEGGTNGTTTPTNPGVAERLQAVAKGATDSVSGMITTAIKGQNSRIDDLNKQISSWDDRLATRQATLKRQFTALDGIIASFQAQQQWLAGQIAGLSANNNA